MEFFDALPKRILLPKPVFFHSRVVHGFVLNLLQISVCPPKPFVDGNRAQGDVAVPTYQELRLVQREQIRKFLERLLIGSKAVVNERELGVAKVVAADADIAHETGQSIGGMPGRKVETQRHAVEHNGLPIFFDSYVGNGEPQRLGPPLNVPSGIH